MRTRPDSNVRPARRAAAQSARGPGRFALARLLLGISAKLLLLSALTSSMPACIIPVGPQWQDPDGVPNSPPEIVTETPSTDMMVTGTVSTGATFTISATDVNVTDTLHIRWLVDGKPVETDPGQPSMVAAASRQSVTQTVFCDPDIRNPAASFHPVRAVVGDRDFDSQTDFTAVVSPGKSVFVEWWLTMDCPSTSTQ